MSEFSKGRSGIQLCYPFEQERLEGSSRKAWNSWPVIVQPKLDGERCRALVTSSGAPLLLSSEENVIHSVPHIVAAIEALALPPGTELDGELYSHGMSFEDIHSRVGRTVNLHQYFDDMEYHIFDLVDEYKAQIARLQDLRYLLDDAKPPLHLVPSKAAYSYDEIISIYEGYMAQGYEGIVVRHTDAVYLRRRSVYAMKFKPKRQDTYRIIGYEEEHDLSGNPKGVLGSLVFMGDDGTEGRVYSGMTHEIRRSLWEQRETLVGKMVTVKYQHLMAGSGRPRHSIFVEVRPGCLTPVAGREVK